jgi:hypothetical protein
MSKRSLKTGKQSPILELTTVRINVLEMPKTGFVVSDKTRSQYPELQAVASMRGAMTRTGFPLLCLTTLRDDEEGDAPNAA